MNKLGIAAIILLVAIAAPLLIVFGGEPRRLELMFVTPFFYASLIYAAVWHCRNVRRYGKRMTLEQIFLETELQRIVKLLCYHHEWTNAKIASVLNKREVHYGKQWTEATVASYTKGVAKVW